MGDLPPPGSFAASLPAKREGIVSGRPARRSPRRISSPAVRAGRGARWWWCGRAATGGGGGGGRFNHGGVAAGPVHDRRRWWWRRRRLTTTGGAVAAMVHHGRRRWCGRLTTGGGGGGARLTTAGGGGEAGSRRVRRRRSVHDAGGRRPRVPQPIRAGSQASGRPLCRRPRVHAGLRPEAGSRPRAGSGRWLPDTVGRCGRSPGAREPTSGPPPPS